MHVPGLNILIPAIDGLAWRTDTSITFEQGASGELPELPQDCDVVPKLQAQNSKAGIAQTNMKVVDLRALTGTIDSGKTHEQRLPLIHLDWVGHISLLLRYIQPETDCRRLDYGAPGGLLGVPFDKAATVPTATAAPTTAATLIKIVLVRFCFAGAKAAPAGLDTANPVVAVVSAAAVPTGF